MADSTEKATHPVKLNANQIAYNALREQGLSGRAASKRLGLSTGYGVETDRKLSKYRLKGSKLVAPTFRLISKAVKMQPMKGALILCKGCKGQGVIGKTKKREGIDCPLCKGKQIVHDMVYPPWNVAMDGAREVLSREEPVKQVSVVTTINLVGSMSELAEFQGTQEPAIDVTPTTTDSGVDTPSDIDNEG